MGYDIGPEIGIDGEAQFREALRRLNTEYKTLQAQTAAVTAEFEKNGDEQGKLTALSDQFEAQIDSQKKKLEILHQALEDSTKKYGENSEAAQKWQRAVYSTQATISNLEKALNDTKSALENTGDEMSEFVDETEGALHRLDLEYKVLQAQTKAVTAEFDKNGDEQGKLTALSTQLEAQIEQQQKRQELLKNAIEEVTAEYGENHEITLKWQRALYESQATVSKLEKELNDTQSALQSIGDEVENAGDEMEDFSDDLDDAGDAALDFGDVLGANLLSNAISNGLSELGDLLRDFTGGMIQEAATLRATTAQYSQSFGDMEAQATASLETLESKVGISAQRMQASYTKIFAFAKTTGAESAQAMDISSRAMAAAADSAAYYDRSIEDVTETLQSFLKGSYANDAALGIACTEVTRNTAANEKYAKSFKDLTEAQKVDVLLSMVEAGNKASGAFGQAARESDSWENVTGELENAWKKLQARLGEPVLENTILLVQKLTEKLDEAGDSEAFEKLADGISNTFVWLMDNASGISRAAGTIAAGIVTFEVATNAAGWLSTLKAAVTSLYTAMSAHPVALAITGLVTLAVAIGNAVKESKERVDELTEASRALEETVSAAQQDYADTVASATGAANAARIYVDRLAEMEEQGLHTAEAHREYELTLESLNTLIPELNLSLDEQTGLVQGGVEAIYDQIEAWKDMAIAAGAQERLEETLRAQGAAMAELETNRARLSMAEKDSLRIAEERNKAEAEYEELGRLLEAATRNRTLSQEELSDRTKAYNAQMAELYKTMLALDDQQETAQQEIKDSTEAIKIAEEAIASQEKSVAAATIAYDEFQKTLDDTEKKQAEHTDTVSDAVVELQERYEELRAEAYESLTTQIGLFEDLSGKCEQSFDDMLNALESQKTAFNNYADNLKLAMERGIDQGLVQKLSDGAKESMLILEALVNGTDEDIAALNEAFGGVEEGRQKVADTMANIQSDYDATMDALTGSAYQDGQYIVDGLVDGLESKRTHFESVMAGIATAGQNRFREKWEINSPSRVAEDIAEWIPIGLARGVDGQRQTFLDSLDRLYSAADFSLPDYSSVGGYLGGYRDVQPSRTVHVSLGEVNISLTAPANTDLRTLAQMVGDTINEEAIRLAVAYG